MRSTTMHIFRKEFKGYFLSPIAYIVISVFLVLTGWFFFSTFFLFGQAEMRSFFSLLPVIFSFIIPAITMRLFSEEFNTGSYELIFTMPVSPLNIITGKFMAASVFSAVMLAPTLCYGIFISFIGDIDWGPVAGGYIGAVLLGTSFSAIGLFASSLTRNQIIAFIIGTTLCFLLTLIDKMLFFLPEKALNIFQYMGAGFHFDNIARGIIDTRDILYFLSLCFLMLYSTNLVIQEKK
jgi:ABC-2 type transport system permease protein